MSERVVGQGRQSYCNKKKTLEMQTKVSNASAHPDLLQKSSPFLRESVSVSRDLLHYNKVFKKRPLIQYLHAFRLSKNLFWTWKLERVCGDFMTI